MVRRFFLQQEFQQKATWLVYMMSALINVTTQWSFMSHLSSLTEEVDRRMVEDTAQENNGHRLIGEMASIVFGLIAETDKLVSCGCGNR